MNGNLSFHFHFTNRDNNTKYGVYVNVVAKYRTQYNFHKVLDFC